MIRFCVRQFFTLYNKWYLGISGHFTRMGECSPVTEKLIGISKHFDEINNNKKQDCGSSKKMWVQTEKDT